MIIRLSPADLSSALLEMDVWLQKARFSHIGDSRNSSWVLPFSYADLIPSLPYIVQGAYGLDGSEPAEPEQCNRHTVTRIVRVGKQNSGN